MECFSGALSKSNADLAESSVALCQHASTSGAIPDNETQRRLSTSQQQLALLLVRP